MTHSIPNCYTWPMCNWGVAAHIIVLPLLQPDKWVKIGNGINTFFDFIEKAIYEFTIYFICSSHILLNTKLSITDEYITWTIPWFHSKCCPSVEVFLVLRHQVIILPSLRYHGNHSLSNKISNNSLNYILYWIVIWRCQNLLTMHPPTKYTLMQMKL